MLKSADDKCPSGKSTAEKSTVKPTAGATFPVSGEGSEGALPPNTWSVCDPSSFSLRVGPDYPRHKRKEPSMGSLLDIVGVE